MAGVAGNPTLFKPKVPAQSTSVSEPMSRILEIQTEEVTAAQLQPRRQKDVGVPCKLSVSSKPPQHSL